MTEHEVSEIIGQNLRRENYRDRKVLLIVPDGTRTAPLGLLFRLIHRQIGDVTKAFDVLIALGTHQPMSDSAILQRLEISQAERDSTYHDVRLFNHEWNNPSSLQSIGVIPAAEIQKLSGGLFSLDIGVEINKRVFEYDEIIIVGPVFPHEVVGFSGGNKYLFPGISGPHLLNFFHWLGAIITTPRIIGSKWTPVRKLIDHAASMLTVRKLCIAMVVGSDKSLAGMFIGSPEEAWDDASEVSRKIHIRYKARPFHTILSCVPPMYDEIWTAGKAMYKLEPVLADGGELIIYAPHVREVCVTHRETIMKIGYHCRDYFLKQWEEFRHYPWGVLAHSSHVFGLGTFENGMETPRARVTLATAIPEEVCRRINLGYRDPQSIRVEDFQNREDDGILHVPQAGEVLYQLKESPHWARALDYEAHHK